MKDERYYLEIEDKFDLLIQRQEYQSYLFENYIDEWKTLYKNNELVVYISYEYIKTLIDSSFKDYDLFLLLEKWQNRFCEMTEPLFAETLIRKLNKVKNTYTSIDL